VLTDAVVAARHRRFWTHRGIDLRPILRAAPAATAAAAPLAVVERSQPPAGTVVAQSPAPGTRVPGVTPVSLDGSGGTVAPAPSGA
jgi:hypothetical protein